MKAYKVRKLGADAEALAKTARVGDALIADLRKQMAEDNVIFDNKVHVPQPGPDRRRRPHPPLPPLGRALLRRATPGRQAG